MICTLSYLLKSICTAILTLTTTTLKLDVTETRHHFRSLAYTNAIGASNMQKEAMQKGSLMGPILVEVNNQELPSSNLDKSTPESLEDVLKKDSHAEGILCSVLSGLALFYNALANMLLYPIFSFLLLALSLGGIILVGLWIKKIKAEQALSTAWILFTGIYFLLYLDLFLVVFQKKKVFFLFLELEKDLLLFITSTSLGYFIGKYFSSKSFEERELP